MTTAPIQCHDCHRRLRNPPIRDHRGRPYGPKCARDRGYAPERRRAVKPPPVPARPVRVANPEQPSLLDLLEDINNEGE